MSRNLTEGDSQRLSVVRADEELRHVTEPAGTARSEALDAADPTATGARAVLLLGDCLERMRELPDNSIDAIVTDPPYGLSSQPDVAEVLRHWLAGDDYEHRGSGFMGKTWDSFVPGPSVWRECFRVLKPGGHLLAFFGTRTYDIGSLAVRLAGFEIRDQLVWVYASGFPKSLDVSKALDKMAGAEREVIGINPNVVRPSKVEGGSDFGGFTRSDPTVTAPASDAAKEWQGWGTALKPAHEPIVMARKPLAGTVAKNVLASGTGAINIEGTRIPIGAERIGGGANGSSGFADGYQRGDGFVESSVGRWPSNVILTSPIFDGDYPDEVVGGGQQRGGGNPKRRISDAGRTAYGAFAQDQETGLTPVDTAGGKSRFFLLPNGRDGEASAERRYTENGGTNFAPLPGARINDEGGKSRFFLIPKASKSDRNTDWRGEPIDAPGSHPTVKPRELMAHLVRLVTPPGGTVLDPFMGSGSTGIAALNDGARFIGIERDTDYMAIARARLDVAEEEKAA